MSDRARDHFQNELLSLVDRYSMEYENFTYTEIIGCLEVIKLHLFAQACEEEEEEEEDENVD